MSETNWGRRKYRTTNWKAYNAALKARGDLSIWLDTQNLARFIDNNLSIKPNVLISF